LVRRITGRTGKRIRAARLRRAAEADRGMTGLSESVNDGSDEAIALLREALRTIRFGSVEFIIHDGRVSQIDRKEKLRFGSPGDDRHASGRPGK
jgi:hypothetical protein